MDVIVIVSVYIYTTSTIVIKCTKSIVCIVYFIYLKFRVVFVCTSDNCNCAFKKSSFSASCPLLFPFLSLSLTHSLFPLFIFVCCCNVADGIHNYHHKQQCKTPHSLRRRKTNKCLGGHPSMSLAKLMSQPHEYSVNSEMTETSNKFDVTVKCIVMVYWRITSFSMSCLIYILILSLHSFDLDVFSLFIMW